VLGKTLLIVVDAHSKWIDAHVVSSTSSAATIDKLRSAFATHGLPQTIVSDNGPAFTSGEFQEFLRCNGIEHLRSTPYHPSSNGLTERAVQTVKAGVKKLTGTLEVRLESLFRKLRVLPWQNY
jgi:transposase InsO family protein